MNKTTNEYIATFDITDYANDNYLPLAIAVTPGNYNLNYNYSRYCIALNCASVLTPTQGSSTYETIPYGFKGANNAEVVHSSYYKYKVPYSNNTNTLQGFDLQSYLPSDKFSGIQDIGDETCRFHPDATDRLVNSPMKGEYFNYTIYSAYHSDSNVGNALNSSNNTSIISLLNNCSVNWQTSDTIPTYISDVNYSPAVAACRRYHNNIDDISWKEPNGAIMAFVFKQVTAINSTLEIIRDTYNIPVCLFGANNSYWICKCHNINKEYRIYFNNGGVYSLEKEYGAAIRPMCVLNRDVFNGIPLTKY